MGLHSFIAGRLRFKSAVSTVSTAISFVLIIVSVAVASGFRYEIGKAVADICGDFRIIPVSGLSENGAEAVDFTNAAFDSIKTVSGVAGIRPVIYRGGIMRSGEDMHGVVFRGTENALAADSLVSIPSKLASLLRLKVGDKLPAYFVQDDLRARSFVVNDIYEGIITADDKLVVNCNAAVLRKLNGWGENEVSAVEVIVKEGFATAGARDKIAQEINIILYNCASEERTLVCEDMRVSYFQIFEWLNLIDSNVTLILVLMVIVAGFNMVTGLLIFIFNNVRTIGVFKSLGMKSSDISKAFMLSAGRSVGIGMLAGNVIALALCYIQVRTGLLTLDPDNYFIGFVPVYLNLGQLLACDLGAFAAIMLILILPCSYISRIEPSVTLKSE